MTEQTTTTSTASLPPVPPTPEPPAPVVPPAPAGVPNLLTRGVYSVGLSAVLSWVGGAAARSWHLSVPFLAGWVVLIGVVLLSDHLTGIVGAAWHREKINAAPQLVALGKSAEVAAEAMTKKFLATKGINL